MVFNNDQYVVLKIVQPHESMRWWLMPLWSSLAEIIFAVGASFNSETEMGGPVPNLIYGNFISPPNQTSICYFPIRK